MVWLPDGEYILKIYLLVSTKYTNVTDKRTDRQTYTARRHRPRLCIVSPGKKCKNRQVCAGELIHIRIAAITCSTWQSFMSAERGLRDRNVYNLVEDVSELLDTPSKRTLWRYIVPLLSRPHQAFCQDVLGLPRHTDSVTGTIRYDTVRYDDFTFK